MTKARIDWMQSGRVKIGTPTYAFVSKTTGKYINSSGALVSGSTSGQHVTEYDIYTTGKTYTFTYWRTSSASLLCVAFLDSSGNVLSGSIYGGSSGAVTETLTVPEGTAKVRIYGIYRAGNATYTANASMTPTVAEGICAVEEMKVKAAGDTVSQVVWPTIPSYQITNARLVYSGNGYLAANGGDFVVMMADIIVTLGNQVTTLSNQTLTPLRIVPNDHLVIDGVDTQIYYISGNRVLARDLKSANAPYGTATTVYFGYQGQEVSGYVQQKRNIVEDQGFTNKTYNGYRIELDNTDFTTSGGTATVTGYKQFTATPYYQWSSGTVTYGSQTTGEEEQTPGSISISKSPSSAPDATISDTTITFPANTGTDENTYAVTGSWSSYSDTQYAYVYGSDTGRTYSNLTISASYPSSGIIPAGGGSIYPTVSVSIRCNGTTLTGSVNDGSTAVEVSGGSYQTTIPLTYDGATNGLVSAGSRGTNEDTSNTYLASVRVTATKGSLSAQTSYMSVYQQRNQKTVTQQGTFSVTAMTVTPKVGGTAITGSIPAVSTTVTIEVKASGSGRTTKYTYTSGATSGGDTITMADEEVTPSSLTVTSGGSSVTVTNQSFTASNQHNLTAKAYSISATYEGTTRTATVDQSADQKLDGGTTYYSSITEVSGSNTLSAAGGEVLLQAVAYHITGKIWESDGAAVEGESSSPVYDTDYISLVFDSGNSGAYTFSVYSTEAQSKTYRIRHRDMENNATTDTLSVSARNGTQPPSSALSYSITNQLEATEYSVTGDVVWGEDYIESRGYDVQLNIARYTSDQDPAPFIGNVSTNYNVNAFHYNYTYHDGTVTTYYYRRYTSWTSEHDDSLHRELVNVDIDSTTYYHVYVSQIRVVGDPYTITTTANWLTLDTTNQSISISPQEDSDYGTPQRTAVIRATNTADPSSPKATATSHIVQQAYQKITCSPTTHNFEWDDTQSAVFAIFDWYVQFKFVIRSYSSDQFSMLISTDGPEGTFVAVDTEANYGNTNGLQQYWLKIGTLSANYTELVRFFGVSLVPQDTSGVSSVTVTVSQEEYDGGLPTD